MTDTESECEIFPSHLTSVFTFILFLDSNNDDVPAAKLYSMEW